MRSATAVVLHTLMVQALGSADKLTGDMLVDKLVDKLIDRTKTMQIDQADLDGTTLAKASPAAMPAQPINLYQPAMKACTSPLANICSIQQKLSTLGMAPSPMQELTISAIAASRGDVRAKAQLNQVYNTLSAAEKIPLNKVSRDIPKAAAEMAGVSAPLGFWDPLGFTSKFPDGGFLLYLREAELKHGRVCMLAFLGIVMGEKYHPFLGGDIDMPAYNVRSMLLETNFANFWLAALVGLGALEVAAIRTQYDQPFWEFDAYGAEEGSAYKENLGFSTKMDKLDKIPGDFGFDPLNLKPVDPAKLKDIQTREINNGRLAMLAVAGIFAQELATGEKTFN